MLIYCKAGVVREWADTGDAPARKALIADGYTVLPWYRGWDTETVDGKVYEKKVGPEPAAGHPDVRPYPTPEYTADDLKAAARWLRWYKQNAGITVSGAFVPTDDATRAVLTAAYVRAKEDPNHVINDWSTGVGAPVTLDAATVIVLSISVMAHVQACFSAQTAAIAAIDAGTVTTLEQLYAFAGWPQ